MYTHCVFSKTPEPIIGGGFQHGHLILLLVVRQIELGDERDVSTVRYVVHDRFTVRQRPGLVLAPVTPDVVPCPGEVTALIGERSELSDRHRVVDNHLVPIHKDSLPRHHVFQSSSRQSAMVSRTAMANGTIMSRLTSIWAAGGNPVIAAVTAAFHSE